MDPKRSRDSTSQASDLFDDYSTHSEEPVKEKPKQPQPPPQVKVEHQRYVSLEMPQSAQVAEDEKRKSTEGTNYMQTCSC